MIKLWTRECEKMIQAKFSSFKILLSEHGKAEPIWFVFGKTSHSTTRFSTLKDHSAVVRENLALKHNSHLTRALRTQVVGQTINKDRNSAIQGVSNYQS